MLNWAAEAAELLESDGKRWQPRPHQVPPDFKRDDWQYWLLLAGRGAGKTDAGAYAFDAYMRSHPGIRGRIIAPTLGDAREACVIGPSGIKAHNPDVRFNTNESALTWPNGSRARIFGAFTPEDVERLRAGGNAHIDWYEELGAWSKLNQVWDQARYGLRLGKHPKTIITTTPRPVMRLRWLLGLPFDQFGPVPKVVVSRATTDDNPYLAQNIRALLYAQYAGTRQGRQELAGELLDDVPNALWRWAMIEDNRVLQPPELVRIVVGVDPAVTTGEHSDETGVVIAGLGDDGEFYVLGDESERVGFDRAAPGIVQAFRDYQADRVIAERNNGGDLVGHTLRQLDADLPFKAVVASRGKRVRAEPIAALYEQGKVHHCGLFAQLEDQMIGFVADMEREPGQSPDRVDALVWALTELAEARSVGAVVPLVATSGGRW